MTRAQRAILRMAVEEGVVVHNWRKTSSRTIEGLAKKGWLRADEGRGTVFRVTPEGRAALDALPPEPTVTVRGEVFTLEDDGAGVVTVRDFTARPNLTNDEWTALIGRRVIGSLGWRWGMNLYVEGDNRE